MAIEIKKAEKRQAKLRLAFTGPSGSGKTFSALLVAAGLGKKILMVDTENHSASLYAGEPGIPDFDVVEIEPPYTVAKYIEAIQAATERGYEVLILDSISHAWAGEGGLLAQKEALDGMGKGNSYTNWASITKDHEKFKAWLLKVDTHLIVTMRSKQDYVLETNDKGKQAPKKVGLAPIQREGMEYEFTMVLDIGMNHHASVSKTRARAFDGRIFVPDQKVGQELLSWLNTGSPEPLKIDRSQAQDLFDAAKKKGIGSEALLKQLAVARLADLRVDQLQSAKKWIEMQEAPADPTQTPNPAKTYDEEVEILIRMGLSMDDLSRYVETLPFAHDLVAVGAHLKHRRELLKKDKLIESMKQTAARPA